MPIWLALAAHVLIPGERLTVVKSIGLVLAFAGVVVALVSRGGSGGEGTLRATSSRSSRRSSGPRIALIVRPDGAEDRRPGGAALWQLVVSAPILLAAAVFFGPFLRDPVADPLGGLGFQIVAVVSAGFLFWFWLLTIYPASSVAAFAFLSPIFGVGLGWLILGEPVGPGILVALVLVCAGLVLINRPAPNPNRNRPGLRCRRMSASHALRARGAWRGRGRLSAGSNGPRQHGDQPLERREIARQRRHDRLLHPVVARRSAPGSPPAIAATRRPRPDPPGRGARARPEATGKAHRGSLNSAAAASGSGPDSARKVLVKSASPFAIRSSRSKASAASPSSSVASPSLARRTRCHAASKRPGEPVHGLGEPRSPRRGRASAAGAPWPAARGSRPRSAAGWR
jgi:uncharacterized membrane protein